MLIDILLLILLIIIAVAAVQMKDLLASGVLLGAYSLIMAVLWTKLNAVDVAFTEASVGAGITTVLLIATLSRTNRFEDPKSTVRYKKRTFLIILISSLVLVFGLLDAPNFGDPSAPANLHVAPRYIHESSEETGVVNMVTAVLASYRGYDTLGETTVIFTAGMALVMLLRRKDDR
jgi:multicomponent Na+:H+ antiporter subunit B